MQLSLEQVCGEPKKGPTVSDDACSTSCKTAHSANAVNTHRTQAFFLVEEEGRLQVYSPLSRHGGQGAQQHEAEEREEDKEEEEERKPMSVIDCWRA